ncbi:dioxygenase [Microbacterium trichothecenolyticum]|uniref:Dioxygenase n=1 Tax=Microbacterium ureisolvens TaxID=2781186 RepID=A0ABS7HTR7_9MICO|nr:MULTISPECIES: dioxygenase [Microbacterium]MBW9108623.1 dioxygenase [Microbacterium ureisolvens]MBW9118982.1 dioxygenase [Microbacterium trichothecenolyticum]
MATGGKDRDARAARERTRLYEARRQFHDGQSRRRTRDNLIAGIVGGMLVLGLIGAQTLYFVAGPGAPEPSPSSTPAPTATTPEPTPSATTTPEPGATPTPTP